MRASATWCRIERMRRECDVKVAAALLPGAACVLIALWQVVAAP